MVLTNYMARHSSHNEPSKQQPDPGETLSEFIRAVYRGDITIYNPSTGAVYDFDTFSEARDVIYSGHYSTEPPSNGGGSKR